MPDDLSRWELQNGGYWHKTAPKGRACPDVGDEMMRVRDLPKLYAAWAESKLEAVTDAIYEAAKDGELSASPLSSHSRPDGDALARAALGLGDRP
jgi:hypothetical protein